MRHCLSTRNKFRVFTTLSPNPSTRLKGSVKSQEDERVRGKGQGGPGSGNRDSQLVKAVLPFLEGKVKGSAEAEVGTKSGHEEESEIELRPIDTPQRLLIHLALPN